MEVSIPDLFSGDVETFVRGFSRETVSKTDHSLKIKPVENGYQVVSSGGNRYRGQCEGDCILILEKELIRYFVVNLPDRFIILHASGLRLPNRTVLFIGQPNSGKTRSVNQLMSDSTHFITDEMVGWFPAKWRIHPFSRPLNLHSSTKVQYPFREMEVVDSDGNKYRYGTIESNRCITEQFCSEKIVLVLLNADQEKQSLTSISRAQAMTRLFPHVLRPKDGKERFERLRSVSRVELKCYLLGTDCIDSALPELRSNLTL
ncbi:MAG: hypothetical protein ABEJ65_09080 [bacterium]